MTKPSGSRNYSLSEQLRLVVAIGRVLPTDPEGWKVIEKSFNAESSSTLQHRAADSLKRKFARLCRDNARMEGTNLASLHKMVRETKCRLDDRVRRQRLPSGESSTPTECGDEDTQSSAFRKVQNGGANNDRSRVDASRLLGSDAGAERRALNSAEVCDSRSDTTSTACDAAVERIGVEHEEHRANGSICACVRDDIPRERCGQGSSCMEAELHLLVEQLHGFQTILLHKLHGMRQTCGHAAGSKRASCY